MDPSPIKQLGDLASAAQCYLVPAAVSRTAERGREIFDELDQYVRSENADLPLQTVLTVLNSPWCKRDASASPIGERLVALIESAQQARNVRQIGLSAPADLESVFKALEATERRMCKRVLSPIWRYGCIRSFSERPISEPVPVAAVAHQEEMRVEYVGPSTPGAKDSSDSRVGSLLTMMFEVFDGGKGLAFPHPAALFEADFTDKFSDAMQEAFEAAMQEFGGGKSYDGRYQVLKGWSFDRACRGHLKPVGFLDGASAGAAAFRGWWGAIARKKPDAEVVVLAEIHKEEQIELEGSEEHKPIWRFGRVDGVWAKVTAVVESAASTEQAGGRYLDTIVVTKGNVSDVERAFEGAKGKKISASDLEKNLSPRTDPIPSATRRYFKVNDHVFKVEVLV